MRYPLDGKNIFRKAWLTAQALAVLGLFIVLPTMDCISAIAGSARCWVTITAK